MRSLCTFKSTWSQGTLAWMRIGEVAQRRELATRTLPEIDALIERAQRVRTWLETATGCDCESIDECALFDDATPAGPQTPFRLPLSRISAGAA
jgi:hypothetical protein